MSQRERGRYPGHYLGLWHTIKGAKSKDDYLCICKGAIEHAYSSWKKDFETWNSQPQSVRGPSPVMVIATRDSTKANWVFDHVSRDYDLLKNPPNARPEDWVTIQVDSNVFLRQAGENVRCMIQRA